MESTVRYAADQQVSLAAEELSICLQWKDHKMTFAMQEKPGEFTSFNFPPNVPAPFNMAAAILTNFDMLTTEEKLRMVPGRATHS